jgi:hypothetical protein
MSETTEIPGQVTIGGETIAGARFIFKQLTVDTIPEGLSWDDVATLQKGDEVEVTTRFRLADTPHAPSKMDNLTGDFTGPSEGVFEFKPYLRGFRIVGQLSVDDREAAWRREHGEPAA